MARVPTLDTEEAESLLGPRGATHITVENRRTARKWLTSQGVSSDYAGKMTLAALDHAYNDVTDREVTRVIEASDAESVRTERPEWLRDDRAPAPQVAPSGSVESAIRDLIAATQPRAPAIDESAVKRIVASAIAEIALPRPIRIEIPDRPHVEIKSAHPVFERVLRLVMAGDNVMLVGPAGCGKSHLCAQVAQALGRDYGFISGSAGVSESALTGWLLPSDGGRFDYQPSEFVRLYETGNSVFLFDELDAMDSNMLLVVNAALANGHMSVPHRRGAPMVMRGPDCALMASANTWGNGASPIYAGRNQLDGATLDRWTAVPMDYDRDVESTIADGMGLDHGTRNRIWRLRDAVREKELRRIVSTRAIQRAARMQSIGDSPDQIMAALTLGWTRDELSKVGSL
jgi:cobaltochelatase CobS